MAANEIKCIIENCTKNPEESKKVYKRAGKNLNEVEFTKELLDLYNKVKKRVSGK